MKKKKEQEKWMTYAALIQSQLVAMFKDDCENHISLDELSEEENAKHFIHAMATVAPALIFNKLTDDDKDLLQFNHAANTLCFEFLTSEKQNP